MQSEYCAGGNHNGIDGRMRRSTVSSLAVNGDVQRICVGIVDSRNDTHSSRGKYIAYMERQDNIGTREATEEPIGKHRLGATDSFLCRLADEH